MPNILVIGGGFAGLWSAISAVRAFAEFRCSSPEATVTLVTKDPYHTIRPRLYEPHSADMRVPLAAVLGPIGVQVVEGAVTHIDPGVRTVAATVAGRTATLSYDRLVLAAGSHLHQPDVPGLVENAFSVDNYDAALALERHLAGLGTRPPFPGQYTAVVVGAGLTGLEVATEMVTRLRAVGGDASKIKVVLVERAPQVAPYLGNSVRPIIQEALDATGVETRLSASVTAVSPEGVMLAGGEHIPAATTIWTTGLRASPLTRFLASDTDQLGRLYVDSILRVPGVDGVFAAGDVAAAMTDEVHRSLMSCQHAIPQGKYAGHNAVCDLLGEAPIPYEQRSYVTCFDLGTWGAVFTEGWDRVVRSIGTEGKQKKHFITRERIYPPATGNRNEILQASVPVIKSVSQQMGEKKTR